MGLERARVREGTTGIPREKQHNRIEYIYSDTADHFSEEMSKDVESSEKDDSK